MLEKLKEVFLAVYVDDLSIVGELPHIIRFKEIISKVFYYKDLGEVYYFLSIKIKLIKNKILLN